MTDELRERWGTSEQIRERLYSNICEVVAEIKARYGVEQTVVVLGGLLGAISEMNTASVQSHTVTDDGSVLTITVTMEKRTDSVVH